MANKNNVSLDDLVKNWLRWDQNATTRRDVEALWEQGKSDELEKRMRNRIEFGTAGLRGKMEAGWARMNDLTVIQASQGLCAYVLKNVAHAAERGVVIGHDHRYNSERWALLSAAAFISHGVKVYLHKDLVHTPMVPFSVKRLKAACGVMITASHNPKSDNGYKVYWENAVQIIGPHDTGIAASILDNLEPRTWDVQSVLTSSLCKNRTEEMKTAYFVSLASFSLHKELNQDSPIKFVNTSMHGVGHPFVVEAFKAFNFAPFVPVKEQQVPDPEFPTVSFPNPEEKGAMDLAIATADKEGANIVLAQDPDADRFSAAEKNADGKWTVFTGDQLGALFASHILSVYRASGQPTDKLALVASTVSSKMVEAMAQKEGFTFVDCLTGFKFIGNTALDLVRKGLNVPFGYEEAIGFMFGDEIRDKDGVAATVAFAELAAALYRQGKTVKSHLDDLYAKYGYFQTSNSYFICTDPPTIDRIFARIRNYDGQAAGEKPSYPPTLAGLRVNRVCDLTTGYDSANPPTFAPTLPLSSGHMIQFRAVSEDGATRITLTTRTSGTEPKIKYYLEGSGPDSGNVARLLPHVVRELGEEWLEAKTNGLGTP